MIIWDSINWIRKQLPRFSHRKSSFGYVGTYDTTVEEIEGVLRENGCRPNPVSYYSKHKSYGYEVSTWAYRESVFAPYQYHIELFDGHDGIRVYCHKEYSWIRHPIRHYNKKNITAPSAIRWCSQLLRASSVEQLPVDQ